MKQIITFLLVFSTFYVVEGQDYFEQYQKAENEKKAEKQKVESRNEKSSIKAKGEIFRAYYSLRESNYFDITKRGSWLKLPNGKVPCMLHIPFEGNNLYIKTKFKCKNKVIEEKKIKITVFENYKEYFTYEGGIKNSEFSGEGELRFSPTENYKKYIGSFRNGLFHGFGTLYYDSFSYEGEFINGRLYASSTVTIKNNGQIIYQGNFGNGNPNEITDYERIVNSQNVNEYKAYLNKYPNSIYAKKVRYEMNALEDSKKAEEGYEYYELTKDKSLQSYKDYINKNPNGRFVSKAKEEIEKIENKAYQKAKNGTIDDCNTYLKKYPNGRYVSTVRERIKMLYYQQAKNGNISTCNTYLRQYPNGKYANEIRERLAYLKVETIAQADAFLSKYPNGVYRNDAINKKNRYIAIQKRKELVIKNSNTSIWTLGSRVCSKSNSQGIIQGVIDQWNEDKSMVKLKIVGGTAGTRYRGEEISKGTYIWATASDFYVCIGDESIDYKMEPPKSYNHNHDLGDVVYFSFTARNSGFFGYGARSYTVKIKGTIEQFNSDKTRAQVKITDDDEYSGTLDGEYIWKGKEMWVYISSWKSY